MDTIVRAVSGDGAVKISAACVRDIAERARQIHDLSPVATAALGRTLCAASILGNLLKEEQGSVTLRINGGGPLGSVLAVSDSAGNPRGYVQNPHADLPPRADGKLDVGGAVGKNGLLTVSRDLGLKEPYIGSIALVSGEIAEDVTAYFAESEQVGAACGLGVLVDTDRTVLAAGGFLVQLLPSAPESRIASLEANIAAMGGVTDILRGSDDAKNLVWRVLVGMEPEILSETPIEYRCGCSRERILRALCSVGEDELRDMIQKGEPARVSCQFCDKTYTFETRELETLLARVLKGAAKNQENTK